MTTKKKTTELGNNRKTSWTAAEIINTEMPEIQWLINEIMPKGFFFLAGPPKIGKSILTLQMVSSIVTGQKFLGFDVDQGRVLYITLEDNVRRIKKRLQNMGLYTMKGMENLEIEERWDYLNKGGLGKLLLKLTKKKYALCVMDTYAKSFLLKDNNDMVEAVKILSPLYEMTRAGEFSFGFVDHHRKNNQYSGDVIGDLAGTGAKGGVADTVWALRRERGKTTAKLEIASRDTDIDYIDLHFDTDRTLWAPQSLEIVKPNTVQARLLSYMGSNGKEAYIYQLSKALGYDYAFITREMNELVNKGLIYKGEKKGKKVPYMLTKNRKIN